MAAGHMIKNAKRGSKPNTSNHRFMEKAHV